VKTLPTLYKLNTQGKIEQWKIEVRRHSDFDIKDEFQVLSTYGELKGKQQQKWYKVNIGKNVGRSNATEAIEQALKEAEAKWLKKKKQGYVEKLKDAQAGKLDSIIQGGIVPMLAHKYEDHKEKLEFPVMVQPKLDGQRCIAHYKNGKVTLWTRTRKPILSCPHIVEELEKKLKGQDELYLDGELYEHSLKDDFEKLMSAVRKQKPSEESAKIEYHI
jgi:ATP-dependent DNA ligase